MNLIRPSTITIVPQLDERNSTVAFSRPDTTKHAVLVWQSANYTVSWGSQSFDGPHIFIDDEYGCALTEFFETHKAIDQKENTWYKCVSVRAMLTTEAMNLETLITSDKNKEAEYETIPAGTWIVRNPKGEQYCMTQEIFRAKYDILSE